MTKAKKKATAASRSAASRPASKATKAKPTAASSRPATKATKAKPTAASSRPASKATKAKPTAASSRPATKATKAKPTAASSRPATKATKAKPTAASSRPATKATKAKPTAASSRPATKATKATAARKRQPPRTQKKAATKPEKPRTLVDDLALAVGAETLGPATVLRLGVDGGDIAIALEEPEPNRPFAEATVTVRDHQTGGVFVDAIASWLGVPVPPRPANALDRPPPYRLGLVWLQRGQDEAGNTWQRAKLCFGGVEELYLIWEASGQAAYLGEKDPAVRELLIAELAFALRDGAEPAPAKAEPKNDPLRTDPVPLVTELVRMPVRPVSVVGSFWRGDRYVFLERRPDGQAILSIGLDRSLALIATIPTKLAGYLHAAGPHLIATAEREPGSFEHQLWIVSPGDTQARLLLDHPSFNPGQMARPVASPDGQLIAVSVTRLDSTPASLCILDPRGGIVEEFADPELGLDPDVWTSEGLHVRASDRAGKTHHRLWNGTSRELCAIEMPAPRFTLETSGAALVIRDRDTGSRRTIKPVRPNERELIEKYGHQIVGNPQRVGRHHLVIETGDVILIDARTASTWVIAPKAGAVVLDDKLELVAMLPYTGGLLLGTIDPRWRTGEPAPELDPAQVRAHLQQRLEGSRFIFDGVRSNLVPADWTSRVGLDELEIVRRLETAGRAHVAPLHAEIEASLASWQADPRGAAARAASIPVPGSAGTVWGAIAAGGPDALGADELSRLGAQLRRLAATAFVRRLQHDEHVRALLGS